jgi:hypothetical protein
LKQNHGNFDANMTFSAEARKALDWWVKNVLTSFKHIGHGLPDLTITTDASKLGWGATCNTVSSGGNWTHTEAEHHVNYLEMFAILLGLQTFVKDRSQVHIRIMTDNTTAISVLNTRLTKMHAKAPIKSVTNFL